jgi:hypothetical protein
MFTIIFGTVVETKQISCRAGWRKEVHEVWRWDSELMFRMMSPF